MEFSWIFIYAIITITCCLSVAGSISYYVLESQKDASNSDNKLEAIDESIQNAKYSFGLEKDHFTYPWQQTLNKSLPSVQSFDTTEMEANIARYSKASDPYS